MEKTKTKSGNNKEELCPCCMGRHAVEKRTIEETIGDISFPVTYCYCPYVNEFYETEEQLSENIEAYLKEVKRSLKIEIVPEPQGGDTRKLYAYISQEKMTEMLLKLPPVSGEARQSDIKERQD